MGLFAIDEIPEALAAHLPAGARLDYPPQGMTSDVVFAGVASRFVVIKRCAHPVYRHWLRREHVVLRALESTALPVPRVLDYAEVREGSVIVGWLVTSRLPGRSLWRVLLGTPAANREPLWRNLGGLLRRLHSTPVPVGLVQPADWLSGRLTQAHEHLSWCDGTPELLARLERSRPPAVQERLIHGDLALDNVLIDDSGAMSLIDWSDGGSGDCRSDVALALQTEPETVLTAVELDAFYAGYGEPPLAIETRRWFEQLYEFF
jgi:aminoglycoside phosphotransferase (APT) family kinase protein